MELSDRVNLTMDIIEDAFDGVEKIAIGYSSGKDSDLILHFCQKVRKDCIPVYCNTTVEARESLDHARQLPDLVEIKPDVNFWWCVDKYGLPEIKGKSNTHRTNACCYYLKEKPMKIWMKEHKPDILVDGLTLAESHQRAMALTRDGHFHYVKTWNVAKLHPIYKWKPKEVLYYLRKNNIPYNPKYDCGSKRIGCITCTAFKNWDLVMMNEYPKMYKKICGIMEKKQMQQSLKMF